MAENGKVYTWNDFLQTDKRYFNLNLSLADGNIFGERKVISAGGKYANRFVITE